MRVQPKPLPAVAVYLVYLAVVAVCWKALSVDYNTVGHTVENAVRGIVITIGLGSLLLIVATTYLGWWRPAWSEGGRVGPAWLWAVPVLLAVAAAVNLSSAKFDNVTGGLMLTLAVGTLLIGFAEELACRGLLIVGFRGTMREPMVWLCSTLLFAVLHGLNVLFGQPAGTTLAQIVLAFVAGTALYICRMVTGGLVVPILVHAFWDFAGLTGGASGVTTTNGVAMLLAMLAYLLGFVGLVFVFRAKRAKTEPAPAMAATA
jgi:membrane protease YdiL (CAAX protease family)